MRNLGLDFADFTVILHGIYNYVTHYMYTAYMLGRNKGILYTVCQV